MSPSSSVFAANNTSDPRNGVAIIHLHGYSSLSVYKKKSESTAQGKINYSSVQRDERRTLLFEVEVTGDDSKEEECEIDIPVRYLCFTGNSNDRS